MALLKNSLFVRLLVGLSIAIMPPFFVQAGGLKQMASCQDDAAANERKACFTDADRVQMGALVVESPEVQELFFIVLSLTEAGGNAEKGLVRDDGVYRDLVRAHFSPFRNHSLVRKLDDIMRSDIAVHMEPKLNAGAYRFTDRGKIVRRATYTWIRGEADNFRPLIPEMENFAKISGFRKFLAKPEVVALRKEAQDYYRDTASFARMRSWLANQFPSTKPYDNVAIWVSPLTGGWQHQDIVQDGSFRQLILNVNYSGRLKPAPDMTEMGQQFRGQIILFTELNHGSLNPSLAPFAEEITRVMRDRIDTYIDQSKNKSQYATPVAAVAEYLNFALVPLYACDNYEQKDCEAIAKRVDRFMKGRGEFPHYAEFQAFLLQKYHAKASATPFEQLLPDVIAWFAQERTLSAPPPV